MQPACFERFFHEFRTLKVSSDLKIVGLRNLSTSYYFSAKQVQRMMEHFGQYEKKEEGNLYRAHVLSVLFSRIVDERHLFMPLDILDRISRKKVFETLGHMNLFNPIRPDGDYELSLQVHDQRCVLLALLDLTQQRGGEMIHLVLNNSRLVGVPEVWIDRANLPQKGQLRCTYNSRTMVGMDKFPTGGWRQRSTDTK